MSSTCLTCNGAGSVASDSPYMMMSAVPCPACSPPLPTPLPRRPVTQELIASVMTRHGLVLVNGTWTTPGEAVPGAAARHAMTPEQRALVREARERADRNVHGAGDVPALCDLADEQAARIASLELDVAQARAAEEVATRSTAELREKAELLRAVAFVPPIEREEGALVIFLPSIQVAINAGFNGFAFELAAETYARALPLIPEGRPVVARVNAKGTMIDVEVRRVPS